MNKLLLLLLAFTGGTALAVQGGLNSQLGTALKNPLLASVIAFFSSTIFAIVFVLLGTKTFPTTDQIKGIPIYLWFTGGFLSMIGVGLYLYTIPKLGISTMISIGLCGQLIFAAIAGHFGWMNLPLEPITLKKSIGILAMISGILITNLK
ncbi:EamA-like transporter family protein [Labilibaculum sp. A4]|uniref:EamA-like transporter family protein n=1 Tax=Labilibaculum euxinus TaxID=2686357 RepID=A0A425Y090_9BACT|nr:DMT family transporter [Labilibaculum euxinus]MDQ1773045.1 DMT family transporter [Labilibaculum euxinus]MUP38533.1 EamA-like transporter family protein [Labilibaculum euxinus]MVB07738.1 EamA-like transporter family protein [Labilibaculum euxinus]MWN78582.1 EamA-like transporter family protein [Labilibaculum euxinus]